MKKAISLLILINLLVSGLFANDFIGRIHMNKKCSAIYVDNPTDEGVTVYFFQSDVLYNKMVEISKKYFPNEDISKLILVGFDSDGSLNNRNVYATTLTGNFMGKSGKMIHFSSQMLPKGIYDVNFEWVAVHELIHVYTRPDVTHTDQDCIKLARQLEKKYGINLRYGKY